MIEDLAPTYAERPSWKVLDARGARHGLHPAPNIDFRRHRRSACLFGDDIRRQVIHQLEQSPRSYA